MAITIHNDSHALLFLSALPSLSAKDQECCDLTAPLALWQRTMALWQQLVAAETESLGDSCRGWSGVQLKCLVCFQLQAAASSPCEPISVRPSMRLLGATPQVS